MSSASNRLAAEPDKLPRTEIEQEIAELEYRLEHLRKSLADNRLLPVSPVALAREAL